MISYLLAYVLAGTIGYLGYRAHALTVGGAVAACLVGGTIFAFGGLTWAVLLVLFFASSSALSFVKASDERKRRAGETFEKGGRRDALQVLANGGVAGVAALLLPLGNYGVLFAAFTGALAAATADTWATEIGVLSRAEPRMITTGRAVPVGTSGGVTLLGSGASLAGALCIALGAALLGMLQKSAPGWPVLLAAGAAGGLFGSLADSLAGATVQASYYCPVCGKATESRVHRCGTPTQLVRGLAFVNNDLVNGIATLAGAIVGVLVWLALGGRL